MSDFLSKFLLGLGVVAQDFERPGQRVGRRIGTGKDEGPS